MSRHERGIEAARGRLADEVKRIEAMMRAATAPERCGPEIPVAPARGMMRVFAPVEMVPGSTERVRHAGHLGRDAVAVCDVFDRMAARGQQLGQSRIATARDYRELVARRAAGGLRLSSLEAATGRGSAGAWIDGYLASGRALVRFERAIGGGVALELRRAGGEGAAERRAIRVRAVVDLVCLEDCDLSEVLRRHGWAPKGPARDACFQALAAALDRMSWSSARGPQDVVDS